MAFDIVDNCIEDGVHDVPFRYICENLISCTDKNYYRLCNKKDGVFTPSLLLRVNRKPCSVLNDDLSRLYVAAKFKPPPESCRTTYALLSGVAADKVYIADVSPHRW